MIRSDTLNKGRAIAVFPLAEIISVLGAVILFFGYLFLPWINVDGEDATAFELLSATGAAITLQTPGFVLPVLALCIGGIGLWGLLNPRARRLSALGVGLGGLIGLAYYAGFFAAGLLTVGIGFWFGLMVIGWFFIQVIIPRNLHDQMTWAEFVTNLRTGFTGFFRELYKNRYLYLLAVPGIIWLLIFAYLPMVGHIIAFKRFRANLGIFGSEWSGFRNFEFFFSSGDWIQVTFNTVFLNLLFITAGLGTALVIAIFLNEIRLLLFKKVAQSIVLLPHFISWLVVSIMFYALFNTADGLVNRTMTNMGIETIRWYSTPAVWPLLLTLVDVWKGAGYTSIIFLAAITAIPDEYYESAMIDGANKLQQMRYITLPLLIPTAVILALLALGRIFYGNFEMIYSLVGDNGILFPTTNVIDTYTFRALRELGNFGMTAAVGLYQATLGLIAVLFFNWLVKRIDRDAGLF